MTCASSWADSTRIIRRNNWVAGLASSEPPTVPTLIGISSRPHSAPSSLRHHFDSAV